MGFAEEFEKNKKVFIGVGVLVLIALVVIIMNMTGGPARPSAASGKPKLFYTADDGKTYFPDDADKIPGFDHGGKPAYRAQVYQCGTSAPFVGYMQRIEEGARKSAEDARAQGKRAVEVEAIMADKIEVKKPGDARWVPAGKGERVMLVTCPDGKTMASIVLP
jgi:hypothetical protein